MKAQRDEAAIYSEQIDEMQLTLHAGSGDSLNFLAMTAAFKAVVIEGIEVVFIVVTVGRMAEALVPAALGATAAALAVVALGLAIHRPLTRVPENALKFGVGVVIVPLASSGSAKDWAWHGPEATWPWPRSSRVCSLSRISALRSIACKVDGLETTLHQCLVPESCAVRAIGFNLRDLRC